MGANRATCWSAPPLSSPESERPWPQRHYSAATARRRPLRPNQAPQSSTGKPNRSPGPLVAPPRSHLAAGQPPSATKGISVRVFDLRAWLWRVNCF
jgi:hypothetical protein